MEVDACMGMRDIGMMAEVDRDDMGIVAEMHRDYMGMVPEVEFDEMDFVEVGTLSPDCCRSQHIQQQS